MQARRRFVEDVERFASIGPRQFRRELNPLRLSAREHCCRLSQCDVFQSDITEELQLFSDRRNLGKQVKRFGTGHFEDIGNRFSLISDFKRLRVVPFAAARLARYPDIGEKLHLDFSFSRTFAPFASPSRHIEAEPPGVPPAKTRFGKFGIQAADQVKNAGIGCGTRRWGLTERLLVHFDNLIEIFRAKNAVDRARRRVGAVEDPHQLAAKDLFHEGAFAAAAHAGDDRKGGKGYRDVDRL